MKVTIVNKIIKGNKNESNCTTSIKNIIKTHAKNHNNIAINKSLFSLFSHAVIIEIQSGNFHFSISSNALFVISRAFQSFVKLEKTVIAIFQSTLFRFIKLDFKSIFTT